MIESEALQFPFVQHLPRRRQKQVVGIWERFQELQRLTEQHGMLMPVSFAAKILDVSRQRAYDLVENKTLVTVQVNDQIFVTGDSVAAYASSERKAGRPAGRVLEAADKGMGELAREAMRVGKEVYKESRGRKKKD